MLIERMFQGTLPVDYLSDSGGEFSAQSIFTNACQILQQYNASVYILLVVEHGS